MSKNIIFVLMYHYHKLSDLTQTSSHTWFNHLTIVKHIAENIFPLRFHITQEIFHLAMIPFKLQNKCNNICYFEGFQTYF
jgi:hypothetical protein